MYTKRHVLQLGSPLVCLTLLLSACGNPTKPDAGETVSATIESIVVFQGHRGARGLKPESTLPSFESALDELMTTLELDLHLTADGRLVVWHDPFVDPAKCGLRPGAPAGAADPDDPATPSEDLQISRHDVRTSSQRTAATVTPTRRLSRRRTPSPPPWLELDSRSSPSRTCSTSSSSTQRRDAKDDEQRANASQVRFNIETKRVPNRPELIGDDFDGVTVGRFEQDAAGPRRGAPAGRPGDGAELRPPVAVGHSGDRLPRAALGADGAGATCPTSPTSPPAAPGVWSPSFRTLDAANVAAAHDAGLLVLPWTVNDVAEMQRLIGLGVDGLITDRPDLAADWNSSGR